MKGLLFITHQTGKYTYLQSVELALQGGCRQIQLRMKGSTVEEVEKTAVQAKALCDKYRADLYVNDHVEVCLKVGAKGVHLGKADMSPLVARSILGDTFVIGGTANTFDDIRHLSEQGVDYIGLGPFRFTTTKERLSPVLRIDGYREIMRLCRENEIKAPVLAVGGVTVTDVPALMQTGVAGVAVSTGILLADDPVGETRRFLLHTDDTD